MKDDALKLLAIIPTRVEPPAPKRKSGMPNCPTAHTRTKKHASRWKWQHCFSKEDMMEAAKLWKVNSRTKIAEG